MRKEPDIVRELREAEENGLLKTLIKTEVKKDFADGGMENGRLVEIVFDGLQDGLSLLDRDFTILRANRWIERLYRDEMPVVGRKCYEVYQKRNSVCPWCPSIKALESGETTTALVPHPSAEKPFKWLELSSHPVKNEDGTVIWVIEHVKDVTEHRKMEKELRESEERLRDFLDNASDLLQIVDDNGRFIYANKRWLETFGYSDEEIRKMTIFDLLRKDYIPHCMEAFDRVKNGEPANGIEIVFVAKDGREVSVEGNVNGRFKDGEFVSCYGIFRDVTRRKRMEGELRESRKHFQMLFNLMADPVVVIDSKGKFLEVTDKVEELTGFKKEELIGKNFLKTKIVTPKSKSVLVKNLAKRMMGAEVKPYEVEVVTKDGRKLPFEVNAEEIVYRGKPADMVVFRDISERKKMEEELEKSYEKIDTLLNAAADGIRIVNRDFTVETLNDTMAKLAGVDKKVAIGMKCSEIFGSDACDTENCSIARVLKEGKSFSRESLRKNYDGETLSCLEVITPLKDAEGNIVGIIEDFRDISDIKKVEEKLHESEELFRTLVDKSPVGIYIYDPYDEKLIYANPVICRELGINDTDDFSNIDFFEYLKSEYVDLIKNRIKKRLTGEKVSDVIEAKIVTPRGEKWAQLHTSMINYNGKTAMLAVVFDRTEQKKFQEELKESEEKFRVISSSAYDAIIMMDDEGNVIYWNKAAEKVFGYTSEEIIGKDLHMLLAPKDFHMPYKKGFEKFIKTGEGATVGRTIELPALKKDGTEIIVELSLSAVKIKDKWNSIGIVRDVTERKKIEKELKIKDEAIKSSVNGIVITDSMGNIVYVNNSFLKMWRLDAAEKTTGKSIMNFLEFNGNSRKLLSNLIEKNGFTGELIGKRKDGSTFPIQISINFIKDENNKINNILASFVDITEQKRAEEEIKRKQEKIEKQNIQLKKLDRIKSEFLNITSHELRTPMAAVKGYAQMLLKEVLGNTTGEQKKALNVILRNINRLDDLISDILDFSRLESGTMKFIPEYVDIKKIVSEITETMQSSAKIKKIKIKTEIQEKLPKLFVDAKRIEQVIVNILNNAIKFSPENSVIITRVKKDKKDKILFEIQDFGKGIPKDKQKKIFETFYQVNAGMNRKYGGAGLGLAVSRGIILAHGGKIWVESKLGEGSTFKFTLPLKPVLGQEEKFKEVDIFGLKNKNEEE